MKKASKDNQGLVDVALEAVIEALKTYSSCKSKEQAALERLKAASLALLAVARDNREKSEE